MVHDFSLRAFDEADLPALHRVREAAFAPVFASFRSIVGAEIAAIAFARAEVDQGTHLDEICANGSGHQVLVVSASASPEAGGAGAHGGATVVGFVAFSVDSAARTGEIGLNAVHPDWAGRGIGTWMYQEALSRMKAAGAAVATVGTGGDSSHAAARRAYAKAGFGPAVPSLHLYRAL